MAANETDRNFFAGVAQYYDEKQDDLNLLLAHSDKIIHHHSGLCDPHSVFPGMNEEELLKKLHAQENTLTERGIKFLGHLSPEMHGLDAGCGRGGSSFMIHRKHGCKMDGVSLSVYQVQTASAIARELGIDSVKFIQANMLKTPFRDQSFDFIWACESTEHIPDLDQMFKEFARVSKSGARLVVIAGCYNPHHPQGAEFAEFINEWYHIKIHSPHEYIGVATQNNWKLLDNVDLTPETIPYWDLRARSAHRTGVEKLNSYYKSGAGEYRLFAYLKSLPSPKPSLSPTILP